MIISEVNSTIEEKLKIFKKNEYPAVDAEHYGDIQPNFDPKEFTLVANTGDIISGYIKVSINLDIAYIDSLLVGADNRGKGIGQKLVEQAELKSKELGAHKIWLETGAKWAAKSFYEKLGYATRTILPNDAGHQDFVLMDKML